MKTPVRPHAPSPLVLDLSVIPAGWWLYGLFNNHTALIYAGDVHVECTAEANGTDPWTAKLQRLSGGMLTVGSGRTPIEALRDAIREVGILDAQNPASIVRGYARQMAKDCGLEVDEEALDRAEEELGREAGDALAEDSNRWTDVQAFVEKL